MISRRLVALTTAALAVLAACTTEEASNPGPTLTSTTSTTTTTTTSTTTLPTTSTTTPTASTAPPTTLPEGPAAVVVPLLIGGGGGGWLSIGAWQVDRWQEDDSASAEDPTPPSIEPGTPMVVSNLDGEATADTGDLVEACFDGRVGPSIDLAVAAPEPPGFGYGAVALTAPSWPLRPRPIAATSSGPAGYDEIGIAAFDGEPVDATLGTVEQLVVADLDGDGDDEALVAFEYVQPSAGPGTPGDLSSILLVDTLTRNSSTVLQSVVDQELEPDGFPLIERFRVIDVADYNGDGRMEVAVHAWYYEGASVAIYEYDGAELTDVLVAGCGA
ncbi:MAG: hypothetical protein WCA90_08695 [Ilumatobacteraceae bacterium]